VFVVVCLLCVRERALVCVCVLTLSHARSVSSASSLLAELDPHTLLVYVDENRIVQV
jgi:hypothetical protein